MLVNAPASIAIQASSTSRNFRLESFSANMSYETCMSTHSGCLRDVTTCSPLTAFRDTRVKPRRAIFPNDIQAAFTDPLLRKNSGHDCMERSRRPNSFALWANISNISPLRFLNAWKNSQPPSDKLTFGITPWTRRHILACHYCRSPGQI
ncbi:hypothetical protein B0H13DRAFT_719907 [Mycena leptocephala]|nr:hypothetical protein B0H13DRAFT_719907 [Mycena leptocephala]